MLSIRLNLKELQKCTTAGLTLGKKWITLPPQKHTQVVIDPPDDPEIKIPEYHQREGETLTVRKARLLYQSRKRGMLENGLLLSTFAAKYLSVFNEKQLNEYDILINKPSNDWDIFYWSNGVRPTPQEYDTEVMKLLKEHVKNVNKESRFRQPDL